MRVLIDLAKAAPLALALIAAPACAAEPAAEPAGKPKTETFSPAAVKRDLADLYSSLRDSHFDLYARRSKTGYDAFYRKMRRGVTAPMSRMEAQVYFQKFAAYGNVAHANVAFPSEAYEVFRAGGGKAFPLFIRFIGDEMRIADDLSGLTPSIAGARIVSVNGESAAALEKRLAAHLSADNAYLARTMLEFRFAPLMWLEFGDLNEFAVEIETPSGEGRTVTVPARAREALASTLAEPIFELDWNERRHSIKGGVGYLRPGPFYNNAPDATDMWDNAAFKTFIDTAFSDFMRADVPAVLIDMRANPGGDNSFSDHMVAWFADKPFKFASHFYVRVSDATTASNRKRLVAGDTTSINVRFEAAYAKARNGEIIDFDLGESQPRDGERYHGKIYMLIDRHSYSNTVTVTALAQDYGFAKILGEETSDLATTYGAMENFTLSETGIEVGYPKAHIIRPNGGLDARGVIPDIAIASPLRAPSDAMLEEALEIVTREIQSGGGKD